MRDGQPRFAVECKSGDRAPNPAIAYFRRRAPITDFYQVHLGEGDRVWSGTRVLPFRTFSKELALP